MEFGELLCDQSREVARASATRQLSTRRSFISTTKATNWRSPLSLLSRNHSLKTRPGCRKVVCLAGNLHQVRRKVLGREQRERGDRVERNSSINHRTYSVTSRQQPVLSATIPTSRVREFNRWLSCGQGEATV